MVYDTLLFTTSGASLFCLGPTWDELGHLHMFSGWNSSLPALSFHKQGLTENQPHGDTTGPTVRQPAHTEMEGRLRDGTRPPQRDEWPLSICIPGSNLLPCGALPTVGAVTTATSLHPGRPPESTACGFQPHRPSLFQWRRSGGSGSNEAAAAAPTRLSLGQNQNTSGFFFPRRNWIWDLSKLLQIHPKVGDQSETLGPHWDSTPTNSPKIKQNQKKFRSTSQLGSWSSIQQAISGNRWSRPTR